MYRVISSRFIKLQDNNPYLAWGRQMDKFIKYSEEYQEHTWEELAKRWMAAAPGLTAQDFSVLMQRGAKKHGNVIQYNIYNII